MKIIAGSDEFVEPLLVLPLFTTGKRQSNDRRLDTEKERREKGTTQLKRVWPAAEL